MGKHKYYFSCTNAKLLYETSRVNRIDREIAKKNVNFIEKCKIENADNEHLNILGSHSDSYISTHKYKPIEYMHLLNRRNQLYENGSHDF